MFNQVKIYKPDPEKISKPYPLGGDEYVNRDASNLVSFFDRMKDIQVEVIDKINQDLSKCVPEFKDLRFDTVKRSDPDFERLKKEYNRDTFKKLGVADKAGIIYWAEDLSEGALYFIALLAIIHQPNPPQLLLLEEPEKGIHPQRITEIIYYIQKLAEENNIQIIITTHSPIVLNQFANDTSSVLVFDKENYVTIIRSMESIIEEKKRKNKKVAAINYEEELSDNWVMGLLNGVPND